MGGARADRRARRAADRAQPANQRHGPEAAPVLLEAGREVGDLQRAARVVEQGGDEDRGVAQIALFGAGEPLELDGEEPDIVAIAVEQPAEYGVAVQPRHAAPDDAPARVDQGADGAVADDAEVEIHAGFPAGAGARPPAPGGVQSQNTSVRTSMLSRGAAPGGVPGSGNAPWPVHRAVSAAES